VSFSGAGSNDPDGSIANYTFGFGDGQGQTGASATASHVFATPGTYTVTLATRDNEGCAQGQLFTGQTAFCSGSNSGVSSQQITVVAKPVPNDVKAPGVPGVKVSCPKSAKPKGCTFTLQAVAKKPTKKHRRLTIESAAAKAKVKPGRSAIVRLHPKPAFAAHLTVAKKILVREAVTAKGKTRTRYLRLRALR
jgi:hypothetical protein